MEGSLINIDYLIQKGEEILNGITFVPSRSNVMRLYSVYKVSDLSEYEKWKNLVIRFLGIKYPKDVSYEDFRNYMESFEKKRYSPDGMKSMIGVLESLKTFPNNISITPETNANGGIVINNTNSQTQNQEQNVNVLVKLLEDSLTYSQLKEIKAIIDSEKSNIENSKPKLIDKIKSFGHDLAPSIVANIITNPSVWSALLLK
jgi:hypothetical protein